MHPLVKFSIKNLNKSKIRSILSILAVFLGVLLITTLLVLTDSLVAAVDDSLNIVSGVIVVQEKDAIDPSLSSINQEAIDDILNQNGTGGELEGLIESYSEEIWHVEKSPDTTFGFIQVTGVNPSREKATVGVLKEENFREGRTLKDNDYNATVLGSSLAFALGKELGDYITVSDNHIEVVGIFNTDSFIDETIFMNLELVRTFSPRYANGTFSTLLIKPINLQSGEIIKTYINENIGVEYEIEASDFDEIAEQGRKFLDITTDFAFYIGLISVVVGSLSVFNSILMSVMERKKEIAILKATGWKDLEVGIEVFLESLFIAAIGGLLGLIGGLSIAIYITSISTFLDLVIVPLTLAKSYAYAVILGILAGLYPAFRAMRIDPVADLGG